MLSLKLNPDVICSMLLLKNTLSLQSDFSVLKWIVCLDYWIISCFDFTYGCVQEDGFGIFLMTLRYTEKKKLPFSAVPDDDQHLPDIHLGLYNHVLVFDLVSKVLLLPVAFLSLILLLCIFQHT
jgi:hypothetical protein